MTDIYSTLNNISQQLRKGEEVERGQEGPVSTLTLDFNPHVSTMTEKPGITIVDFELLAVGVNNARAEQERDHLRRLVDATFPTLHVLQGGPSYIHLGAILGDQGTAFQLMAVGQVLGWWKVITPTNTFKVTDPEEAKKMAGAGMIWVDGYKPDQEVK